MLQNFFRRNYVAIGTTSVKIIGNYAASGVNYAFKSFIILATVPHFIKCFCPNVLQFHSSPIQYNFIVIIYANLCFNSSYFN
jgi:hypothetical protein